MAGLGNQIASSVASRPPRKDKTGHCLRESAEGGRSDLIIKAGLGKQIASVAHATSQRQKGEGNQIASVAYATSQRQKGDLMGMAGLGNQIASSVA